MVSLVCNPEKAVITSYLISSVDDLIWSSVIIPDAAVAEHEYDEGHEEVGDGVPRHVELGRPLGLEVGLAGQRVAVAAENQCLKRVRRHRLEELDFEILVIGVGNFLITKLIVFTYKQSVLQGSSTMVDFPLILDIFFPEHLAIKIQGSFT